MADSKKLSDPAVIESSIDRLIESPKFNSMSTTFVEQWLDLESLSIHESSNKISSHIVFAMRREPVQLFQNIFRENRSLLDKGWEKTFSVVWRKILSFKQSARSFKGSRIGEMRVLKNYASGKWN